VALAPGLCKSGFLKMLQLKEETKRYNRDILGGSLHKLPKLQLAMHKLLNCPNISVLAWEEL